MLRFILYFLLFIILFRTVRSVLGYFFKSSTGSTTKNEAQKKKSKFENVEEANYIDIKPEDEKKN
ncbi:MAG: hypothetical protein IPJ23_08210 [Ignavibacteriales bacterium]|nr:hypothetical protein [Ignavibacteriales bacterium]